MALFVPCSLALTLFIYFTMLQKYLKQNQLNIKEVFVSNRRYFKNIFLFHRCYVVLLVIQR